jgi:hypothetical protein
MAADPGIEDADIMSDARLCTAVVGEELTAYVAGAESVGQYRRRLAGDAGQRARIASRLAATRRVLLAFQAENAVGMCQPWLRDVGADGEIPARIIRDKGDDEAVGALLAEAAGLWLRRHRLRSPVAA